MKLVVGCISFTEGKSETKPTPSLRILMRALLNIPIQYHQEQTENEIPKERSIRRRHFHTYTHSLYFPLFSCPAVPRNYVTYCTLFIPGGPIKLSEFRTTSDTRSSVSLSLVGPEQEPVAIIQECSWADSTFMTIESLIALWHTFIYESRCSTRVLS